jgi:hypothetical protein
MDLLSAITRPAVPSLAARHQVPGPAPSTAINSLDSAATLEHNSLRNARKFMKKFRSLLEALQSETNSYN